MIYTEEELKELKEVMEEVNKSSFLPESQLSYIWNNHVKIQGKPERQPCSCGSAAKHWKKAMNTINTYLSSLESKTD